MKTKSLLLLASMLPALCACSGHDPAEIIPDHHQSGFVLKLAAADYGSFAESRAWTDQEEAVYNEGKINSAIVFVSNLSFEAAPLTPASPDPYSAAPVLVANVGVTGPNSNGEYTTDMITTALPEGKYYAIAIANATDLPASTFTSMSLRQILDYVYSGDVCTTGANRKADSNFRMSSCGQWEFTVAENQEDDILMSPQPLLMKRLAARIDLSFGSNSYSAADGGVRLPVYDYTLYQADGTLVETGDTYTVTGVKLTNVVSDNQYMVFRTKNGYFTDEGSQYISKSFGGGTCTGYYAETGSRFPSTMNRTEISYDLSTLLSDGNNLYTDNGKKYYTVAYVRENCANAVSTIETEEQAKRNKTTLQIIGSYNKFSDLDEAGDHYTPVINITLRHCKPTEGGIKYNEAMAYAVGRNSIYRVRIDKVFGDAERVYVVWYYDSDNNAQFDTYTPKPNPFGGNIIDDNSGTTPND